MAKRGRQTYFNPIAQRSILIILAILFCSVIHGQSDFTSNPDSALIRGDQFARNFQYGKALQQYYECVRSDNQNVHYINKLAYCYYQLGNNVDAEIYYKRSLKLDSTNITANIYLGSIAERESETSLASAYYGALIEIDSTIAHYHKLKARVDIKLGQPLRAFQHYQKALEINPTDIETIADLAKLYLQSNDLKSAQFMIDEGLKINSSNKTLRYLQTNVAFKLDSFEQVIRIMESILAEGDTINHYEKLLAMSYLEKERYDDARIHLIRLTRNEKPNELTYYRLAQAYDGLDSTAQSIRAYEMAIDIGISNNVGAYYKNIGVLQRELNQLKSSMIAFKEAYHFSRRPDDLFFWAKSQDEYYADKRMALANYQKYLRIDGEKSQELVNYTQARILQLKEMVHQQIRN
ncbi:MAG: tetratricopeptide repeat protein [Bacteroidia bacterium]|nr:tetratricopeptide repeat protein [Bacteroidia bacterium]